MPRPVCLHANSHTKVFLNPLQSQRPGARPRRKRFPIHIPIAIVLAALLVSGRLQAQSNGITAAQGTSITPGTLSDSLWADSSDYRWKVNNDGVIGDLALCACPTQSGGFVYAGSMAVSGVYPESCLSLNSDKGVPLLAGALGPVYGGTTGTGSVISLNLQVGRSLSR
jgi:hypothetical protein